MQKHIVKVSVTLNAQRLNDTYSRAFDTAQDAEAFVSAFNANPPRHADFVGVTSDKYLTARYVGLVAIA